MDGNKWYRVSSHAYRTHQNDTPMSLSETTEIIELLNRVRHWPNGTRMELIRRLLEISHETSHTTPARVIRSVRELIGIGASESVPPDDETTRRWVDEHQLEKYR